MAAENATKVVELMEVEAVLGKVLIGGEGRGLASEGRHGTVAAACDHAPRIVVGDEMDCAF